jgi:hypothetical protein
MKVKALLSILMALVLVVNAQDKSKRKKKKDANFLEEVDFHHYIPVDNFDYEAEMFITTAEGLQDLSSASNATILSALPNETMSMNIKKISKDGTFLYSTSALAEGKGRYQVTADYTKYRVIKVYDDQNQPLGMAKVGIGVRITANYYAPKNPKQNVADLPTLGANGQKKAIVGSMSMDVIGIESQKVTERLPVPAEINTTNVQVFLRALQTIMSKTYEEDVRLKPQVVALKPEKEGLTLLQFQKELKEKMNKDRGKQR